MKPVSLLLIFVLAGLLCQCITPINPDTRTLPPSLVVDGLVTDQPGRSRVSLSLTADYTATSLNYVVQGAAVFVTDNTDQRTAFNEISPGFYQPDSSWRGTIGRQYTLHVRLSDGREYQSKPELIRPIASIDSMYVEYSQQLKYGTDTYDKGFDVYLDLQDPATPNDYYRWSWVHYEIPQYCKIVKIPVCGNCLDHLEFGMSCCGSCWDIVRYQNLINITSDQAINGNRISRRSILRTPFNSYSTYYVEIEQQSLTKEAYEYLATLKDQIQNTGGLFDAAPATLVGNMSRVNDPEERVLGYFGASAMTIRPLYVDRRTAPTYPDVIPSPPPLPQPAPCEPCIESAIRTGKKPIWWRY
ncbi:DUF4249 domain-containing protein [Larkinella insperata]|uniref:DUF4249 domain-containing protein n=1 Tax=Larkinella insperata TaxID=332158 RepID=A0ABW3Q2X7_9BACT|nr:DUF4249 domain-containing protein [Larkinella insperata]